MKLYERIKKHEHKFSDTEDMIVEYILKNKTEVVKSSIQSLADKFYTVPNTIIRLCKKMEYDGFSQLKNNLKNELKENNSECISNSLELDIKKTLELIDYEKISRVADLIKKSKNIIIYGIGQNTPICEIITKELKATHINVNCYNQRHEAIHNISKLNDQDILFTISLSGTTEDILEGAKIAKSNKCKVIALTHLCENELQDIADISLYCYSPLVEINGYKISDKVSILIVIRAIMEQYWRIC
ncbi:MAG: MurR/RpiR family transcriptional regulator [Peptostreptococcaceae bacterium]